MTIDVAAEPRDFETPSFYATVSSPDCAQWYLNGLDPRAWTLQLFVPGGFQAYACIPHPKWQRVPHQIQGAIYYHGSWMRPVPFDTSDEAFLADEGQLVGPWADILFGALSQTTDPTTRCTCCLWDGYGGHRPPTARIETGMNLGFLLYSARLDVIARWLSTHRTPSPTNIPTMIWPPDEQWCVVTPFQFFSTYIAGTDALIDALLARPDGIDVRPASLSDRLR